MRVVSPDHTWHIYCVTTPKYNLSPNKFLASLEERKHSSLLFYEILMHYSVPGIGLTVFHPLGADLACLITETPFFPCAFECFGQTKKKAIGEVLRYNLMRFIKPECKQFQRDICFSRE